MFRSTISVLALLVATTVPSIAADYEEWGEDGGLNFREGYPTEPKDWSDLGDETDPLKFEVGLRYWYSMGRQQVSTFSGDFENADTSHIGELHLRIEDHATSSFAKAIAGAAMSISGTYDDPFHPGSTIGGGQIGYLGTDFGWNPLSDGNGSGLGPLVGYLYWHDSPWTVRSSFTTQDASQPVPFDQDTGQTFLPMDSTDNVVDIQAMRLGVQGKAVFNNFFDIEGELVGVPYAKVTGTLSGHQTGVALTPLGNLASVKASATTFDGWGYGGMGQVMLGFHPAENFVFRLGGRAWYVQGVADTHYTQAFIGDPTDANPPEAGPPPVLNAPNYDTPPSYATQQFIEKGNPFSILRYGLLAELTYSF